MYEIFQDIDFLQHRGQQYYGIAAFEDEIHLVTDHGRVGVTFDEAMGIPKENLCTKCWNGISPVKG